LTSNCGRRRAAALSRPVFTDNKKAAVISRLCHAAIDKRRAYIFLVTLLERRQRVQTLIVLGVPSTSARTFLKLGFHFLLVRRIEWLTLFPKTVVLSQTAHLAISNTSFNLL